MFFFNVNECLTSNGGCLFLDVNECLTSNGGCSQTCSNTVGSYTCLCDPGFALNVDGRTCDGLHI